jgi:O-acetyl-ADP-ribose deacetylase (regulator of RNase III)
MRKAVGLAPDWVPDLPMASPHGPREFASGARLAIGTVKIRVRSEPIQEIIVDTDLDAIVSSDDSMLSMGGGVSAAIGKLGGPVRDEVAADLPLAVGSIAVTSGGRLPIRYIIHAITLDADERVIPNARTIRQLFRQIFSRCEALNIRRIAIPALATGTARVDSIVAAENLAHALRAHTANPTVLESIVLPIPDQTTFDAFARALAAPGHEGTTGAPEPGSLRWSSLRASRPGTTAPGDASDGRTVFPHARRFQAAWRSLLRSSKSADPGTTQAAPEGASVSSQASGTLKVDSPTSRPLVHGRYVLLEEIGRGGMAVVHLAWDLVLRRTVAIKILRPDCADPMSLKNEASTAFGLTHDGIVRLYHFEPAHDGADAYLVMEYLSWPSGEQWIADAGEVGLPIRAVRLVGLAVCDALAYAHSRSILHLDVKPSNIFVDPAGETAKLGDFGLARVSGTGGTTLQIRPVGTPAYMAPEQMAARASVSAATDVYQMAATLWDFLTGFPPMAASLDLSHVTSDRQPMMTALSEALVPDPTLRPTASRLQQLIRATPA